MSCVVVSVLLSLSCSFFFNDTATTEIYTLSLHDALPICSATLRHCSGVSTARARWSARRMLWLRTSSESRSEEHTSELQSHHDLVCRLLLEKKKKKNECSTEKVCANQQRCD